jgi:hypothetical protein
MIDAGWWAEAMAPELNNSKEVWQEREPDRDWQGRVLDYGMVRLRDQEEEDDLDELPKDPRDRIKATAMRRRKPRPCKVASYEGQNVQKYIGHWLIWAAEK